MREADHINGADPASDLDVGLPVDTDVRDYLKWKGEAGVDRQPPSPAPVPSGVEQVQARGVPLR